VHIRDGKFNDIDIAQLFCPVNYSETSETADFFDVWTLAGFQDANAEFHDNPPCGTRVKIHFTNTLNMGTTTPKYQYVMGGNGPINGFGCSYEMLNDSTIVISGIIAQRAGGPIHEMDYEEKLFGALSNNTLVFKINNNILSLRYNEEGDRMIFFK
jgi:hypothetical protein